MGSDNDGLWIWFFQCRLHRPFEAAGFRAAREELAAACLRHGLPSSQAWDLSAAADELLSNVMEHSSAHWLDLGICQNAVDGMIRLRLLDDGQRFDVALAAGSAPERAGDGTHRQMGLVMLKGVSSGLDYRALPGGGNELVVKLA